MKKVIASILLSVLLLTGCSVTIKSKPSESPTPTRPTAEQSYVQNLRNILPTETQGVPDAELIESGKAACGALDSGVSFQQIVRATMDSGIDPGLSGGIVGAAVRDLCPDHQAELDAYLDSLG
jgi:PBP1b-binding outer membrane lipoprotein LpoB